MKRLEPIETAEFPKFDGQGAQIGTALETARFNSCRFCLSGRGTHRVTDTDTGEVFFVCEAHRAAYDEATDTAVISAPVEIVEPAPGEIVEPAPGEIVEPDPPVEIVEPEPPVEIVEPEPPVEIVEPEPPVEQVEQ